MSLTLDSKAPNFTLQNTQGDYVSLSDFKDRKNVVLLFFPLAFSSVCTKELCITRDNMKLYNSVEAEVLGISVDSFYALGAFKKAENINFTLLSDFNKEVSSKYDVLEDNYFGMRGVAKRATFIIDTSGVLKYKEILENAGQLPDFTTLQDALFEMEKNSV